MRRFSLVAVSFIFTAIFAASAFAQAAPATGTGKIGLVNTYAFGDDKAGITKFKNAMKSLDTEFTPVNNELKTMGTRYQSLQTEIQTMQKNAQNPAVPVKTDTSALQAKIDEYQALETNIKRKQEDAKAKYERRYQEIVGPVFGDILKALNEFAKAKGYAVILDGAKLEEAQILLGFDDKYDITNDFVTYYNSRPAGTASTATPK
jgi:Skp family chaperone for outer membrane proteins